VKEGNQQQHLTNANHFDDEINLIDLWLVIMRRKWLALIIFLLCVFLGLFYAVTRPVRFEYRTGIELARAIGGRAFKSSKGFELLIPKESSVDLLEHLIIPRERKALFGENSQGAPIKIHSPKDSYNLTLATVAQPEEADHVRKLHKAVAEALTQEHEHALKQTLAVDVNPLKARAEVLREQVKAIEAQLDDLTKNNRDENAIRDLIFAQQMGDLRRELAEAKLALSDAESSAQAILEANQGTSLIYLAARSKSPTGADKYLIVALSLVLGCMLGVIVVFITEFLHRAMEASRQQGQSKR